MTGDRKGWMGANLLVAAIIMLITALVAWLNG